MQGFRRFGSAAGLMAPFIAFIFISAAISSHPSFSWTDNALSDLGVVPGVTCVLFTVGLCGGGILALLFAVLGLYSYAGDKTVGRAGAAFFAAAAASLILIGVFNEHFSPTHYIVSVAFFFSAPLAFFILTAAFHLRRQKSLAAFTIITGLVAATPWILQLTINYVPAVAIPETISGLAVAIWVMVLSKLMLKPKT